jgi:hypothetical protein
MAGYKRFVVGEVLTAANVNGLLMKQAVMRFDDAADRTAQLDGDESEGMLSYNEDTGLYEYYDGSGWVVVNPPNKFVNFAQAQNTTQTLGSTEFTAVSLSYTPANASNLLVIEATFQGAALWGSGIARTPRALSAKLRDTTNSTDLFALATIGRVLVAASTEPATTNIPVALRAIITAGTTTARTYAAIINGFTDINFGVLGDPPNIISVTELLP